MSAKSNIPRGFRPSHIPCMDTECQQLLEQYSNSCVLHIAGHLVECLDNARRARWEEMTSSLHFTHSRRKGWNHIRKLSSGQQLPSSTRPSVTQNAVASHLVTVDKASIEHQVKRDIIKEWRAYRRRPLGQKTPTVTPISPEEVDAAPKKQLKHDNRLTYLGVTLDEWVTSARHSATALNNKPRCIL